MSTNSKKLTTSEIKKQLLRISDWTVNAKGSELSKTFAFSSFVTALGFIAKITVHAEILQHHPVIELSYGKVKVKLSTNDVKGISHLDFELAKKIDGLQTI
jgi:4a-hydroxytetrahydrobiopterin dehydratase